MRRSGSLALLIIKQETIDLETLNTIYSIKNCCLFIYVLKLVSSKYHILLPKKFCTAINLLLMRDGKYSDAFIYEDRNSPPTAQILGLQVEEQLGETSYFHLSFLFLYLSF